MLAVGLSLTVGEILLPLRNRGLVALALLANFVLMPLAALAIARLLRLEQSLSAALMLLGPAAGAPFLPKLAAVAKGILAFAVGLMVMLMALTVGYMPLLLEGVSVDATKIARSLVLLMLVPLAAGLGVKAKFQAVAARVARPLNKLSTLTLVLLIVLLLATNIQNIADTGAALISAMPLRIPTLSSPRDWTSTCLSVTENRSICSCFNLMKRHSRSWFLCAPRRFSRLQARAARPPGTD
jgi:predicted Na+-dependent transporter